MKILLLNWKDLAHGERGGAEVYTDAVTREWVRAGHEVTWFCGAVPGQPVDEMIDGVRHVRRGSRLSVYPQARRFWKSEGRGHYDVVVDQVNTRPFLTPDYVRDAQLLCIAFQVCREIWWHESPWPVALVGRFWLERRWLTRYAEVPTATISASSAASLRQYGLRDVSVVPIGAEPRSRPAGTPRELQPTVIFVGRLSPSKRVDHVVEAFRGVRAALPDAALWIVGEGPDRDRLKRAAGPGVTFWGHVTTEERDTLMARAHVLVMTSVREGWGLVVDEAAWMGTPTLAYDVAGLRDSVPAAGGRLTAPTPTRLAAALLEWLPTLTKAPAEQGWAGGTWPWADVAAELLKVAAGERSVNRSLAE